MDPTTSATPSPDAPTQRGILFLDDSYVLIRTLAAAAELFARIVDVPGRLGLGLWNWLVSFGWAEQLHLSPIEPIDLPPVGMRVGEPLIAGQLGGRTDAGWMPPPRAERADGVRANGRHPNPVAARPSTPAEE